MNQVFTIPNLISFSRLLAGIPLCTAIFYDAYLSIVYLTIFVIISDYADGYFSRRLGQMSNLGKVIDPAVDFLLLFIVSITLLIKAIIPLWFFTMLVTRYALISALLYRHHHKTGQVPLSTYSGKVTICITSLTILSYYFNSQYPSIHLLLVTLSIQMMGASLIDYYYTYNKV
ncbi:CDP-alcohol phosphatidyltransferase family protein [Gammaproteobacteria bacterium]|nr:CDP-alcohol phosphatidyltransferase family protein [Gammaproteobacteria bacterium]